MPHRKGASFANPKPSKQGRRAAGARTRWTVGAKVRVRAKQWMRAARRGMGVTSMK